MSTEPPPPTPWLPRAALRLGFMGLAPLAIAALLTLSEHERTAQLGVLAFSLYAAVLLSFLGGVRCGFELMRDPRRPNGMRLFYSALPGLGGWFLTMVMLAYPEALGAAAAFSGLFAAQYVWDHRSANAGAPEWYPMLRQVLTGGAMLICMLIPLATALQRF